MPAKLQKQKKKETKQTGSTKPAITPALLTSTTPYQPLETPDPASQIVAYRIDMHHIPVRGSSVQSSVASTISSQSLHLEIHIDSLVPRLRQSTSSKFSRCNKIEAELQILKRKASSSTVDNADLSTTKKEIELLEAQHEFLTVQIHTAESTQKEVDNVIYLKTHGDLSNMRDLVSRTLMNAKAWIKDSQSILSVDYIRIQANMNRSGVAYALTMADCFRQYDTIPDWLQKSDQAQKVFKDALIREYAPCRRIHKSGRDFWCPVLKGWFRGTNMRAAHLLPHHFGYHHVGCLMGEPNNGYKHVWTITNGLHLHEAVQRAFDRGLIVIVPVDQSENGKRWQVRVVDKSLLTEGPFVDIMEDDMSARSSAWAEIHGSELDFDGATARPGRRYLYAHYVTTLLRTYRAKKPGWELTIEERKNRQVWATPGKWYRESTLKDLARYVADDADAPELFKEAVSKDAAVVPVEIGEEMSFAIAHEDEEGTAVAMERMQEDDY